jgi:MFS family permease
MPNETADQPSLPARWYVLLMMSLVYSLSIADRYVTSTVLDPIRVELHLTDTGVALSTGSALAWFYVVLGFPLSWLIDRYSRRNIIAASVVAWSAMTALTALAHRQWSFVLARIGVGIGEAGGTPGANSLLSDYFPPTRRSMALTIFSLGAPIGAWFAADVGGAIADRYGWRLVFLALGIPGVLVGILTLASVGEPRRGRLDEYCESVAPSIREALVFLWEQRSAVHLIAGGAVTALWGWGLMFWTPTLLQRLYGMTPGEAGAFLAPMHLWGGIGATLFTSWLVGQPVMSDSRRVVKLLGYWIIAGTVASAGVYSTHSLTLAKLLLWFFVPSLYFYLGPNFGILNNLAKPRMRAIFCAVLLFTANVGNLVVAPQGVGILSDWLAPSTGPTGESLRLALLCLVPTGFWAAAHFFWSARGMKENQRHAVAT